MISDEDDEDQFPDINIINQNNLSSNLIKSSQTSIHSKSHSFLKFIQFLYIISSLSAFFLGTYVIILYPSIEQYVLIYSYFFIYTFIWPITFFFTLMIVALYKLLYQQQGLMNMSQLRKESKGSEIGAIMLKICLFLFYLISIPLTVIVVLKLITIHLLFAWNDLKLFSAFIMLNILSSFIFYLMTYLSYSPKPEPHEEEESDSNVNRNERSSNRRLKSKRNREGDELNMVFDNDYLKKIELEVLQSQKISGIIEPNPDLIRKNNYFNKQVVNYINQRESEPNDVEDANKSSRSIISYNEEDYTAIEQEKRNQKKASMKRKIQLNILDEEDEEDTRKNQLIEKINKQLRRRISKDDDSLSKPTSMQFKCKIKHVSSNNTNKRRFPKELDDFNDNELE